LLKVWATGHPGGVGTLHAGTALGALHRFEQLIQEPAWATRMRRRQTA
jgi:type IV secretion system protein TrbB